MREGKPANRKRRRTRLPLWRWRSNPNRRRDDVLEAWLLLLVWALMGVGGTIVGLATGNAAEQVFAQQREERITVRAVLLNDVPRAPTSGMGRDLASAQVRWTATDGSAHRGMTLVSTGRRAGSMVRIWIDAQGKLSTQPPTPTRAAVEAGLLGASAALALSGVVFGVGSIGRCYLDRRRIAQWDREWNLVGPVWGHKTS
ncbi:Rv1733c family protein [Streptomyces olivaceoviridis]|uniref:Rv1733c family protein n=1 Tax=Streptomyces olivaceoviridis TaxID=1921 RepID=UPI0036FADD84